MQKFRTHYDNLKVSRDAPIEVIQAAYRSLARKYHPDRTGGNPKGEAIMKSINVSYEVLSDPARRAAHDQWIATQMARGGSGFPWNDTDRRHPDHGEPAGTGGEPEHAPRQREFPVATVVLALCYLSLALFLIRMPGIPRIVGIVIIVVGWILLRAKKR